MCSSVLVPFIEILCLYFTVVRSHNIYVNESFSRIPRQADNGCVLPLYPEFGQWSIYQTSSKLKPSQLHPGVSVPDGTILQVSCKTNYKLDGDATVVCINAEWTAQAGPCLKKCPPFYNTERMTVSCTYNTKQRVSCEEATDGARAQFTCADFYEDQGLERQPYSVCFNGRWSRSNPPECVPICGQKTGRKSPTLVIGGKNVTRGEYPWQVALYDLSNKNLLCGGSLLNQRVVLTAAHCVTDEDGKLQSKELFMLAAGKYFRNYSDSRDSVDAQFSPIYDIYIPKNYKGEIQNYFGDIAVIITKKTFVITTRVQPVCVDWAYKHTSLLDPAKTKYGYVSGWGYTAENDNPSEVLKELKVPLIRDDRCNQELPEDYRRYLTDDKLCAGYLDSGTSVCRGDSGGGLVAQHGGRYYIVAVVSLSPQAPTAVGGCDSQQYALYTKISYYTETFVLEKEARFRPSTFGGVDCEDDPNCKTITSSEATTTAISIFTTPKPVVQTPRGYCILPQHPKSGGWKIFGAVVNLSPGMLVSPGTVLQISCDKGNKLIGPDVNLCDNGEWSSKTIECLRTCPPLYSTETVEVSCSFRSNETENCENPLEGTLAKQQCAPFYEDLQLTKNAVRVCRDGSWDLAKAECVPVCGKKTVMAQPLIVNGTVAQRGDYPWHVGIYRGRNKKFVCSGALISQKVILTAAHCVTNYEGKVAPKRDYVVTVGKYSREYYDPSDFDAQSSKLKDIFIPLQYGGIKNNYLGDIAVLVAEKTFTLSLKVQPVCVDWGAKFDPNKLSIGYLSGWGYTKPSTNLSDKLRELEVPIVTRQQCFDVLSDNFRTFITNDKLCAGYVNMSTSACNGDAGGALVSKVEDRYYIIAVTSLAPSTPEGGCDSQKYALYTRVSDYNAFLLEKEAQFKPTTSADGDCSNNEGSNECQTSTEKTPTAPGSPTISRCILPQHPLFGRWNIYGGSSTVSAGNLVESGTVLQIVCQDRRKLEGDSIVLCENGKWSSNIGKCLKTCPSVQSTPTVTATCIHKGKEVQNCSEPTDGMQVKYECAPFYEDKQLAQNPVHICQDGSWDHKPPQCTPVCGQKTASAQILVINGTPVKRGEYPWHVAIYRGSERKFICGGSLISQRVILTAAQCVTNSEGVLHSKDLFTVAAGKYYRKFDDARERLAGVQFSTLQEIFISEKYKGLQQNFFGDIAILITTQTFTLSVRVQPVCLEWGMRHELSNDSTGYITGWGYTSEEQNPSDELRELLVPVIDNSKCRQDLPESFKQFFTSDKYCAGYLNEGKSVCKGDSGGGLVIKYSGKYYISGILVVAPASQKTGGCDSQKYALYTKVQDYIDDFILPKTFRYVP